MKGLVRAVALMSFLFFYTFGFGQNEKETLGQSEKDIQWLHFSVIGFEQAGASSTQADQRFFFDFYVTRPLPFGAARSVISDKDAAFASLQKPIHWWGNVRLASFPQQVNAPIGEFVTGLGNKVSEVKINEFVQSAEFRTGFDLKLLGRDNSRFSFFAGYGGVGPMDPKQSVSVFNVPQPVNGQDTVARSQFFERYPVKNYPGLDKAQFVAFSSPDRSRFYHQYAGGLRFTQLRDDNLSPASVFASFGQHELVSGGKAVGTVGIFEAFFPFKIGTTSAYIFGRALMSLRKNVETKPIFLEPAIADNKPVQPASPNVFVISTPSDRDVYTVGFGIDPLQLIQNLLKPK